MDGWEFVCGLFQKKSLIRIVTNNLFYFKTTNEQLPKDKIERNRFSTEVEL